jgi:hypothetical protein
VRARACHALRRTCAQTWSRREQASLQRVLAAFGPPPLRLPDAIGTGASTTTAATAATSTPAAATKAAVSNAAVSAKEVLHEWADISLRADIRFKTPAQIEVRLWSMCDGAQCVLAGVLSQAGDRVRRGAEDVRSARGRAAPQPTQRARTRACSGVIVCLLLIDV